MVSDNQLLVCPYLQPGLLSHLGLSFFLESPLHGYCQNCHKPLLTVLAVRLVGFFQILTGQDTSRLPRFHDMKDS